MCERGVPRSPRMCGIGAILDPAGACAPEAADRMLEQLRHRGPDGEALRRIGPTTLAHTRLAIVDVEGGDQPLDSEDGAVTLVANGEIYNHVALRAKLGERGHRFATGSDCEAILHAYEESGPDCVRELNGIFAFALWDDTQTQARGRPRRVRRQAALLVERRPARGAGLGDRGAAGRGADAARGRPRGARPLPRLPLRPRPAHALQGDPEAAGGLHADRRGGLCPARARPGARRPASPTATSPTTRSRPSSPSASPTPWSAR